MLRQSVFLLFLDIQRLFWQTIMDWAFLHRCHGEVLLLTMFLTILKSENVDLSSATEGTGIGFIACFDDLIVKFFRDLPVCKSFLRSEPAVWWHLIAFIQ